MCSLEGEEDDETTMHGTWGVDANEMKDVALIVAHKNLDLNCCVY